MTGNVWEGYAEFVAHGGGFRHVRVSELLTIAGRKAAGARIIEDITKQLAEHGIGHLPPSIPRDKTAAVLLYNQDQPGLGAILHQARQLAENPNPDPNAVTVQVLALTLMMQSYRPANTEQAA
ncbi:hypothetical protein [Streptomyces rubiginosohelvolus]|uniref:hypothetical protein n=1 Tax=Streptomyces rubiginosohelvolus TaxID=67362 RepID=UPI0035D842E2